MLGYPATPWEQTPPGSRPPGADPPSRADPPKQTPPQEQTPPFPWEQTPPLGADTTPQTRHLPPGSRLQHTVYERPVRILLECILVLYLSSKSKKQLVVNIHYSCTLLHYSLDSIQVVLWDQPFKDLMVKDGETS